AGGDSLIVVDDKGGFGFRASGAAGTAPGPFTFSGGGPACGLLASQASQSLSCQALVLLPSLNPGGKPSCLIHLASVGWLVIPYLYRSRKRSSMSILCYQGTIAL